MEQNEFNRIMNSLTGSFADMAQDRSSGMNDRQKHAYSDEKHIQFLLHGLKFREKEEPERARKPMPEFIRSAFSALRNIFLIIVAIAAVVDLFAPHMQSNNIPHYKENDEFVQNPTGYHYPSEYVPVAAKNTINEDIISTSNTSIDNISNPIPNQSKVEEVSDDETEIGLLGLSKKSLDDKGAELIFANHQDKVTAAKKTIDQADTSLYE